MVALLVWTAVALVAWIIGKLIKGPGYRAWLNIVFGIIGGLVGEAIVILLVPDAPYRNVPYTIVVVSGTLIGAAVFTLLGRLVTRQIAARNSQQPMTQMDSADIKPALDRASESDRPAASHSVGEIFISYASPDRATAKALAAALVKEGWSVWWDRAIPPGKSFDEVIEAALAAAKCAIVLWSKTSVTSDWVKVEASEAAKRRILIPVLIEEVSIPLEFRRIQAASLVGWRSTRSHPGFDALLGSVTSILGSSKSSTANQP
jgi:uncharacterized membrane protein YeaQ/YmgE (transglycosylase-associated protein family)